MANALSKRSQCMQNTSHSVWELDETELSPLTSVSNTWCMLVVSKLRLREWTVNNLWSTPIPGRILVPLLSVPLTETHSWHWNSGHPLLLLASPRPLRAWSAPGWEDFQSLKREEGGPAPRRDTREPQSSARQTHLPYRACPLHHTHNATTWKQPTVWSFTWKTFSDRFCSEAFVLKLEIKRVLQTSALVSGFFGVSKWTETHSKSTPILVLNMQKIARDFKIIWRLKYAQSWHHWKRFFLYSKYKLNV